MELKYGFKPGKIDEYLGESGLKGRLTNVKDAFTNAATTIETACNTNWSGNAKDKFVQALKNDVSNINARLDGLYTVMDQEIHAIAGEMAAKDKELIS